MVDDIPIRNPYKPVEVVTEINDDKGLRNVDDTTEKENDEHLNVMYEIEKICEDAGAMLNNFKLPQWLEPVHVLPRRDIKMVEVNDEQSGNVEGNGEDTDDVDDNADHDEPFLVEC